MKKQKSLDVEIDLVAFISLLSVCICFLLLTVIWVRIGAMEVKQAVGGQAAEDSKKTPTMWAFMKPGGTMVLELQDAPKVKRKLRKVRLKGVEGEVDYEGLKSHVSAIRTAVPDFTTVLIQPQANSVYERLIQLMDFFRKEQVSDLGVVPL